MQGTTKVNADKTNSGIPTGSAVPDAPPKILRNEADSDDDNNDNENEENNDNMDNASTDGDDNDSDIATITVNLRTILEVDFNEMETNPDHVEIPRGTEFHGIIGNMEWCMHHVDERLFDPVRLRNSDLLEDSKNNSGTNDGNWMDQLLFEPGLERIDVVFAYRAYKNTARKYELVGENGKDVTVGQFVKAVRDQLQHAEADIRKFSGELSLIYNDCFGDAL
ncbi:hypothetical protein BKA58DRAFT_443607 [Alternaria rosae]|uniref:uncharacterized protein n=1 Tax=Alternaria rosae TaxID=1187941 RepID=UPI001E8E7325|nr:uncharacterized protein BKA58DRAFT_443607 [Alternaria rosae]KAH6860827.1 hypothetical protein BKA58DRAFT_443607 [Alternaria rosae]